MKLSRRTLLKTATALCCYGAIGAGASTAKRPFFERTGLPIGLQLYTLGDLLEKDFHGALQSVAAIGYRTVELAGFAGRTPQAFRATLDEVGLKCTSVHIAPLAERGERSLSSDLERLAADIHALAADYVVMPGFLPHDEVPPARLEGETQETYTERILSRMTEDDWKRNADFLNEKGRRLQKLGLRLAYHNHNFEFRPVGETNGLEILLRESDPALVHFEMDAGWVAAAGHDPVKWLTKYPGRFRLMHLKDIKASTRPNFSGKQDSAEVGSGTIDWKRLLSTAYASGVRNFYVEQEPPFEISPIRSITKSYTYLSEL